MRKNILPAMLFAIFAALVVHRIWRSASLEPRMVMASESQVSAEVEGELYLTPAGKYTRADIAANGPRLPSERYRGFQARHDFNPVSGDRLCPISRTKANSECTWIINGEEYEFCCPPCIDELVRLAKERPQELDPPAAYVKQ
jgi:hypothetical protein